MCEDTLCKIYECLKDIEATLNSDEYEFAGPFTIGGATGTYYVKSPYNTECEWSIVSALGVGTLGSTATFSCGSQNPTQPGLSATGADSFGSTVTQGSDGMNALQSYVGALTAQAPFITYGDNYFPLPPPTFVYVKTSTPASTEILVTVQFRRKLLRLIPDKPRVSPQTYTVMSRRTLRNLPAQSPMTAGFNSRTQLGTVPYRHEYIQGEIKRG